MIRQCLCVLWFLLLCSAVCAAEMPPNQPRLALSGGFIQYQDWMRRLDASAWRNELSAMRNAGMDTVIIQWLKVNESRFLPAKDTDLDPTQILLDDADTHGMRVYIGLAMEDAWWQKATDAAYLEHAAGDCIAIAEEAWQKYGRHRSFAGWYIPQETWDAAYTGDQIGHLRAFLRRISDRCKALSGGKLVAFAPFFSGSVPPDVVAKVYTQLLDGAGIDLLMPQDGVGARAWEGDVAGKVAPYFGAFRDACLADGVELWADLESFQLAHGLPLDNLPTQFEPTRVERLKQQIVAEAPYVAKFVTFDFFHYLSPYRGAAQKQLYADYVRDFVTHAFLPVFGRSIQVDPAFNYYQGRTAESLAAEVRANGYSLVRYVLTADSNVDPALIAALQREHIGVWYTTFCNGTYSTKDLPAGWEKWRMVTRSDLEGKKLESDGFTRLCLNNPDYRAWKKRQVGQMMRMHPFQGVDLIEPHWPEYPGVASPAYGCFCPSCLAAFRKQFPEEMALPDVLHADSPRSPQRNPILWRKWLQFRQASLTDFLNDLVNGADGIRRTAPDARVCVWTLALTAQEGVQQMREECGEDAAEIARMVRPDLYCFQTHWSDWMRADLKPDYAERYRPFQEQVRRVAPDMPLMVQADTGSQPPNRRSWDWIAAFEHTCATLGVTSTTCYEYCLGAYMNTDPPRLVAIRRQPEGIELRFTRRLAANAADPAHYELSQGRITAARLDGNCVTLSIQGLRPDDLVTLTVRNLADDAAHRFFPSDAPTTLILQRARFHK
ncbi:MAG TPA: DUF4434 domain-containing protein [Chthonomonadaceae bacterium]|nr:DUF4434 domain-containing protein [Chthonomonadaceae bacterium]